MGQFTFKTWQTSCFFLSVLYCVGCSFIFTSPFTIKVWKAWEKSTFPKIPSSITNHTSLIQCGVQSPEILTLDLTLSRWRHDVVRIWSRFHTASWNKGRNSNIEKEGEGLIRTCLLRFNNQAGEWKYFPHVDPSSLLCTSDRWVGPTCFTFYGETCLSVQFSGS